LTLTNCEADLLSLFSALISPVFVFLPPTLADKVVKQLDLKSDVNTYVTQYYFFLLSNLSYSSMAWADRRLANATNTMIIV
jgi:hypothetical protein